MTARTRTARPPFWRNTTFLKWAVQILLLAGLALFAFWIYGNFSRQYGTFGDLLSFDILRAPAGIQLEEGFNTTPGTGAEALLVGLVNTIKVAVTGTAAATIIGLVVGISRLSSNWLVAKVGSIYVETFRNIPLLVQMLFWAWVFLLLSRLTDASGPIPGWFYASNRGLAFATLRPTAAFWQWLVFVLIGLIAARFVYRARAKLRETTGDEAKELTWAFTTLVLIALIGWFLHPIFGFVGSVFDIFPELVTAIPVLALQLVIAAFSLFLVYRWVRRFRDSRRVGGRVKLDDDDVYRLVFTSLMGLAAAVVLLIAPAISERLLDFFEWIFGALSRSFTGVEGMPLLLSQPEVLSVGPTGLIFAYADTGFLMTPGFIGVWVGVTLYTAAFIGEAVRAGILAVPKGQVEAGLSAGLRRGQLLRLVVLPQALRVIIPPVGNQYLNLTKNTSLGLAVGYAEIVAVGRILAADGAGLPAMSIVWMAFYLAVALITAMILNAYNRRVQLVER